MIEFFIDYRQFILLAHVFGVVLGLGGAVFTDFLFLRFLKDFRVSAEEKSVMDSLSLVIWGGLALLIVSGLALFLPSPGMLLHNAGFQAKMMAVAVILINGLILNFYVSPKLTLIAFNDPNINTPEVNRVRKLSPIFGGISIISWSYTFVLGSMMSYLDFSFMGFLSIYLALLAAGITTTVVVTKIKFQPKQN